MDASELSGFLDSGERIVWHGGPPSGLVFRASDWVFIPFSFLWFGFALFWEAAALTIGANAPSGPPLLFPIFGFFFVCVGFYMAIGRFLWDAYLRGGTLYALTNRRAIVLVRRPMQSLRSVELSASTEVAVEESGDGNGSITFGARSSAPTPWRGWRTSGTSNDFVFERVSDVRSVLRTVREIQSKK